LVRNDAPSGVGAILHITTAQLLDPEAVNCKLVLAAGVIAALLSALRAPSEPRFERSVVLAPALTVRDPFLAMPTTHELTATGVTLVVIELAVVLLVALASIGVHCLTPTYDTLPHCE
jgi:hypothetical protein